MENQTIPVIGGIFSVILLLVLGVLILSHVNQSICADTSACVIDGNSTGFSCDDDASCNPGTDCQEEGQCYYYYEEGGYMLGEIGTTCYADAGCQAQASCQGNLCYYEGGASDVACNTTAECQANSECWSTGDCEFGNVTEQEIGYQYQCNELNDCQAYLNCVEGETNSTCVIGLPGPIPPYDTGWACTNTSDCYNQSKHVSCDQPTYCWYDDVPSEDSCSAVSECYLGSCEVGYGGCSDTPMTNAGASLVNAVPLLGVLGVVAVAVGIVGLLKLGKGR